MTTFALTHPNHRRFWTSLLCVLFTLAPITPLLATGNKPVKTVSDATQYPILRIGPGDLLSIFVYGENTASGASGLGTSSPLTTEYQVDSDGVIMFPFLGRVKLEGLTPAAASEKIAKLLSKPRKVTVLIKESNTYWVSVLGNVAKPGRYQITGRPTLLSSLAEAGGPLPGTDMGGAILIHSDIKMKINLNKFLTGEGKTEHEPYLYPGDTLMVQSSPWPSLGEWAIVASILASAAILTVELQSIRTR